MGSANLSTKRQRIAELARTKAGTALSTLHHVIDLEWMREAYRLTRKDGATGIDGVTAAQYEANLEANLLALLERIKSGRYVAPPVRRVYIPKADGSERSLVCLERKRQFAQPSLDPIRLDVLEDLTIHARRALVGAAQGIGVRQNVLAADLVVEGVEAVAGFCLRFRVQRRLQFLNAVRS